jgi:outer membrane protein assembly factor BamE (lipoprotein component of BamABCDE complex)
MKKLTANVVLFLLVVFILFVLFVTIQRSERSTMPEKWTLPENWQKLEKGMTKQQVEQILGKPKQIIRRAYQRWYYQEAPRKIHAEPAYGYVTLRPEGEPNSVIWYVNDWVEPDWPKVHALTQKK